MDTTTEVIAIVGAFFLGYIVRGSGATKEKAPPYEPDADALERVRPVPRRRGQDRCHQGLPPRPPAPGLKDAKDAVDTLA